MLFSSYAGKGTHKKGEWQRITEEKYSSCIRLLLGPHFLPIHIISIPLQPKSE
jgi:hypothetical protein